MEPSKDRGAYVYYEPKEPTRPLTLFIYFAGSHNNLSRVMPSIYQAGKGSYMAIMFFDGRVCPGQFTHKDVCDTIIQYSMVDLLNTGYYTLKHQLGGKLTQEEYEENLKFATEQLADVPKYDLGGEIALTGLVLSTLCSVM